MPNVNDEDWAMFRADAVGAAEAMQACLLELEETAEYDSELINTLYRALHTFKGICRMMGLPHIERVAHGAEDMVSIARERQLCIPPDGTNLLLACLDFLAGASDVAASTGRDDNEASATELVSRLTACTTAWVPDWQPNATPPSSEAGGVVLFDDEDDVEAAQHGLPGGPAAPFAPKPAPMSEAVLSEDLGAEKMPRECTSAKQPSPGVQGRGRKQEFVRIQAHKVEELLNLAAEIGMAAHGVTRSPAVSSVDDPDFSEAVHHLDTLVRELRDSASTLALVPIESVFSRMKRVVRDIAAETGKMVNLVLEGEDTEVDKAVVDQIADPLLHLIRNAADHGLESPDVRKQKGKKERGTITLRAEQHAGEVVISVSDDGAGLNRDRILERARQQGLLDEGVDLEDGDVWDLIFRPGFSTAQTISKLSGRGVGMDVVRSTIQALHGSIRIATGPEQGTRISLHLPLSLAFLDGLVVQEQDRTFVFPLDAVDHIYRSDGSDLKRVSAKKRSVIQLGDELAPVCWLGKVYNFAERKEDKTEGRVVVVLQTRSGKLAVPVERLLGSQQVTMKPLYGAFQNIRAASACSILGSGAIAITLDCERLYEQVA